MNTAKCPNCDQTIANVHYETHDPSSFSGYRGSHSFTAVAYPCGHAISAVPVTWEMRLEELDKMTRELNDKVNYLYKEISELAVLIRDLNQKR